MKKLSILLAIIALPLLTYAAGDTIRIEAETLEPVHYEQFGEWSFEFNSAYPVNGQNYKVHFQYVSEEMTGTFTKSTMAGGFFNMIQSFDEENKVKAQIFMNAVQLVVAYQPLRPGLRYLTLDATVDGSDGNVYVVHGEDLQLVARDTITYVFPETDLHIIGDTAFQVVGKRQGEVEAAVQINNPAIVGNYSLADLVAEGTYLLFPNGKRVSLLIDDRGVASKLSVDTVTMQGKQYNAQFSFLATDTVLYQLRMTHHVLVPKDTIDIVINNLSIDDMQFEALHTFYVDGYNDDYAVLMEIISPTTTRGTFTSPDAAVSITKHATKGNQYTYSLYSKVIVEEVNDSTFVRAEVIATDSTCYHITMRQLVAPTDTIITLAFDTRAYIVPNSNGGSYQVYNMNDEYLVSVAFIADKLEGEFSSRNYDIVDEYTYLHHAVRRPSGKMDTLIVKIADTECVVRQTADSILVDATIKDYYGTLYKVAFWYAVPVPKDTIDVTISKAEFYDALEYGSFQVRGISHDNAYLVSLSPYSESLEGEWTLDGMFKHSDFYDLYTYMFKLDSSQVAAEVIYLLEGKAASFLRNDTLFMDASFVCSDDRMYNLHFIADTRTRLQYDAEEGEIDYTFETDAEGLFITKYFAEFNEVFLQVKGNESPYPFLQIGFFLDEIDAIVFLPEGDYPIDYTYQHGTVEASPGILNYYAFPSVFGYLDNEGNYILPFWFFFSGNVSIQHTANGIRMEVDALNSYDRPIHLVYEGKPAMDAAEGIEMMDADKMAAKKYIQDGELRIRRANGAVYTILGQEVTD